MARATVDLKNDVYRILAWSVFLPVLAVWPFHSALQAISLFGGDLTVPQLSITVLLLTGFWSIFGVYLAATFARDSTVQVNREPTSKRGLLLGAYASAWTIAYLIVALPGK